MKLYAYNVELYALSWPKITRQPCKLLQNPPPPSQCWIDLTAQLILHFSSDLNMEIGDVGKSLSGYILARLSLKFWT